MIRTSACGIAVLIFATAAGEAADLAQQAKAILKSHCFACHGEGGANEGGFNFVLNRKRLVRELVVPGSAEESRLFERVKKGEMPPEGDRVPDDEVKILREWIESGAPALAADTPRAFITAEQMFGWMREDLEKVADRDRPFFRYFTL